MPRPLKPTDRYYLTGGQLMDLMAYSGSREQVNRITDTIRGQYISSSPLPPRASELVPPQYPALRELVIDGEAEQATERLLRELQIDTGHDFRNYYEKPDLSGVDTTTVHACPIGSSNVTPCCGRTPWELLSDRMTLHPELVTCPGLDTKQKAE